MVIIYTCLKTRLLRPIKLELSTGRTLKDDLPQRTQRTLRSEAKLQR